MCTVCQNMEGPGAPIYVVRLHKHFKMWQRAVGLLDFRQKWEQDCIVEEKVADRLGPGHGISLDDQSVSIPAQIRQDGHHSHTSLLFIVSRPHTFTLPSTLPR